MKNFINKMAAKVGYVPQDVNKNEVEELNERLEASNQTALDLNERIKELREELAAATVYLNESLKKEKELTATNETLMKWETYIVDCNTNLRNKIQILTDRNAILQSQLRAEETERLAKDAILRQIQNVLDRHYKV